MWTLCYIVILCYKYVYKQKRHGNIKKNRIDIRLYVKLQIV